MKKYQTERKFRSVPKIGRPKKWETVEELDERIQAYFDSCFITIQERRVISETDEKTEYEYVDRLNSDGSKMVEQIRPFTVTGLAIFLDVDRDTLLNYEKKEENRAFFGTIKRAKRYIHEYAEEYLYEGKNQTGAIFNLKNNWGWEDKTIKDVTSKINVDTKKIEEKAADILAPDVDSGVSPEVAAILNNENND